MNILEIYRLLFWGVVLLITLYIIYKWTIRAYLKRRAIRVNGEEAKAKVIYCETIELYERPDEQIFYRSYLEFTTKSGEKVVVRPKEHKPYKFAPGSELTVCYLRNDPNQFYIKEIVPFQIKFLPLSIIIAFYCLYNIAEIIVQHT